MYTHVSIGGIYKSHDRYFAQSNKFGIEWAIENFWHESKISVQSGGL